MLRYLVALSAAIFFLSYFSPQLSFYGRGLRVGLPAFCLGVGFAFMLDSRSVFGVFNRHRWIFILAAIFMLQAAARFLLLKSAGYDIGNLQSVYVYGVAQVLMAVLLVMLAREFGTLQLVCHMVLFAGGISLCLGIPILLEHSGIARQLMVYSQVGYAKLQYRSGQGVGIFAHYTGVGVAFLAMYLWMLRRNLPGRVIYSSILGGLLVAVSVSTFSMATLVATVGLTVGTLYWITKDKWMVAVRATIVGVLAFVFLGTIVATASETKGFMFAFDKLVAMYQGISEEGFVEGEQTGRAYMVAMDLAAFFRSPIFGVLGFSNDTSFGHGHSSLTNTLVVHGALGAACWFAVLVKLAKITLQGIVARNLRYCIYASWALLFVSGIMNPTWHLAGVTGTVFLFLMAIPREQVVESVPMWEMTTAGEYQLGYQQY